MDQKVVKWILRLLLFLLILVSLYIFLKLKPFWQPFLDVIQVILVPLVISFFLSYILHPIVGFLIKQGIQKVLAILIIFIALFGIIYFIISQGVPSLIRQINQLQESLPLLFNTYKKFTQSLVNGTSDMPPMIQTKVEQALDMVEQSVTGAINMVFSFVGSTLQCFFELLLVPFITYYMLKDYKLGLHHLIDMTHSKYKNLVRNYFEELDDSMGDFIRSQIFISIIVGGVSSLIFYFIGLDYSLIFGAIIGITNIIPYFGPFLGAVPVVIYAFTISGKTGLITVLVIFIIQFVEGNILSPIIVGKSVSMHPVTVILLLLAGGELAGIIGMVLVIPFFSFLKVTFFFIRDILRLKKAEGSH